MANIGRNAPCPCGSGKKYKRCCLPKPSVPPAPQPVPPELPVRPADVPAPEQARPAVRGDARDAEPAESDDDRFWRLFWDRLSHATVDEQIALAQDVIEHRHDVDGETAFSLVEALLDPLRRAGRAETIDRIIERIQVAHPKAYAAEASWMDLWRGENATLRPGADLARPLATLLARPDRTIDEVLGFSDRLRYHGRVEELLAAMLRALPKIERSGEILNHGKWEYRNIVFSLLLERHLERDPALRADDADFLRETAPVRDTDADWLERIIAHAGGRSLHRWQPRDFDSVGKPRFGENLFFLTLEFGGALHRQWGWPPSRAELGRERLNNYLAGDRHGHTEKKARRGSAGETSWRLRPGRGSADRFMDSHLEFLGPRPYQVAAFVQALPRWLAFAAARDLVSTADAGSVWRALAAQWRGLPDLLDRYVYDPVMMRDVRQAVALEFP